jgi:hypothetical protein
MVWPMMQVSSRGEPLPTSWRSGTFGQPARAGTYLNAASAVWIWVRRSRQVRARLAMLACS